MGRTAQTTCRLTVDGNQVPVSSFAYDVRANELGASLSCVLANRKINVNQSSTIKFEIGVIGGSGTSWITLIPDTGGVVTGKQQTTKLDGDTLTLTGINALADRWALRPAQPITIYDTALFSPTTLTSDRHYDVRDTNGDVIPVLYVPAVNLDLTQVLYQAYVVGCGFASVVTNLPNFPVWRADFTIQEGYHIEASKRVQYFSPIFFADDSDHLYIIDVNSQLPASLVGKARLVSWTGTESKYISSTANQPVSNVFSSALLAFMEDTRDPSFGTFPLNTTTVVDSDITESGVAGQPGWHRTEVLRTIIQFHEDLANPVIITRTVEAGVTTRVWAMDRRLGAVRGISVGIATLTREEIQTNTFQNRFYLPTGYTKVTNAMVPLPFPSLLTPGSHVIPPTMQNVMTETEVTTWAQSAYDPNEWVKKNTIRSTVGLVLTEDGSSFVEGDLFADTFDFHGIRLTATRTPILDAANADIVVADGSQNVEYTEMFTEHEIWKEKGAGQIEKISQKVNQLTGATESGRSFQHIADAYVRIDPWRTVIELIPNEVSEEEYGKRKPMEINAYEIPYDLALPVAERKLVRGGAPPNTDNWDLPFFDAGMVQGAIRNLQQRTGPEKSYIVTAYSIRGDGLGTVAHSIRHVGVQGVQLFAA